MQADETILTPATVSAATFGKLYSFPVDSYIFAQPLFVSAFTMVDGKSHNVLFAVTAHGTVYAFDADNRNPSTGYLWKVSLIPANEEAVTPADFNCPGPFPESVAIGTPVIDRTGGALYVVSKTKSIASGSVKYIQRIHALNLADGTEKYMGPTVIQATVAGTGDGSTTVTFNPLVENQRAALTLSAGSVYIAWASHCDMGPYHGWVLGYNARNLSQQTAVFNDTPNGVEGGIWMGAGGITTDAEGSLYLISGNGTFDADTSGSNYSSTTLKLSPGASGLSISDYFTPSNQENLSAGDLDPGTTDAMLFPSVVGGTADLVFSSDKTGRVYILDANNLGKYRAGANGIDLKNGDLQDFSVGGYLFRQPAYFNGKVYIGAEGLPLQAFSVQPGMGNAKGTLNTAPVSTSLNVFSDAFIIGGTSPIISANGTQGAIVWAIDNFNGPTVLHAFDASNLAIELYNSTQAANNRDESVPQVEFQSPVIANGHVFLAGKSSIAVYGLLSK